jgi:hypothetical protein
MDAALAAIDDAAGLVLDRRNISRTDVTVGVDPHRRDVGGAKAVFARSS